MALSFTSGLQGSLGGTEESPTLPGTQGGEELRVARWEGTGRPSQCAQEEGRRPQGCDWAGALD